MSQLAVFHYMKKKTIPFLGFWSKPKSRFLGKSVSEFDKYLSKNVNKSVIYEQDDGVCMAMVLGCMDLKFDGRFFSEDPVVETVRRQSEGSYWLIDDFSQLEDMQSFNVSQNMDDFCAEEGVETVDEVQLEEAKKFLLERLSCVGTGEVILVSVS